MLAIQVASREKNFILPPYSFEYLKFSEELDLSWTWVGSLFFPLVIFSSHLVVQFLAK